MARRPMDSLADRFEAHRPHLRGVAYRMLGSTSEADDAVQEAWLRLSHQDAGAIGNLGGWLTTVVSRISLNMLRARAARDELIDSSPDAARQLASRARRRVRQRAFQPDASMPAQRVVVDAFFAAGQSGDFAALAALLDPDVQLRADFGRGGRTLVRGAEAVAGRARMFATAERRPVAAKINGVAGAVIVVGDDPVAVMAFTVAGGRVVAIDTLGDPARVGRLDLSAAVAGR